MWLVAPTLGRQMRNTGIGTLLGALGRHAGLVLRVLMLVAALLFLARGVQWDDLTSAARHAGFALPALIIALNACMMAVNALRLRVLLRSHAVSFGSCFLALLTSSAINNVTPFRGGDVARLWMLNRAGGVTKSAAAAIAVVENFLSILVLATISFFASLAVPGQKWATIAAPIVFASAVAALALLRLIAGRSNTAPVVAPFPTRRGRIVTRIHELLVRLGPGFRALSEAGVATRALGLSLVSWSCESVMVVLCARSLGLSMGLALAPVILLGINLALALPSTPAGAGAFESAAAAVLILAGVAKGPAVAFALLYHAIQVIPVTLAGVAALLLMKRIRLRLPGKAWAHAGTPMPRLHGGEAPVPPPCGAPSRA